MSDTAIECAFSGRIGLEPALRTSKSGKEWLSLSVAVGSEAETQWLSVSVFGDRVSELAILAKGTRVYVEGRLRLDTWTAQDGRERSGLKVAATLVQPLGQIGRKRVPSKRPATPKRTDAQRDWQRPAEPDIPF